MFDRRKDTVQTGPQAHFEAGINDLTLNKPAPQPAGRPAIIGAKIIIDGDISGSENLVIEGQVKGHVNLLENRVDVGPTGSVNADIRAKIVKVDGEVVGDIHCGEKVIISSTGNVRGNIVAPRLSLEDGAKFKGSIDMDPSEPVKERKPAPAVARAAGASASNGVGPVAPRAEAEASLTLKSS